MLKTTGEVPPPGGEPRFSDLAERLVEDAKDYARAEIDLAKAVAADKARGVSLAAGLLVGAVFVAMGAINALCVAIFVGLAMLMSPVLAGIVAFTLIGSVAALIGWIGYSKLRDAL